MCVNLNKGMKSMQLQISLPLCLCKIDIFRCSYFACVLRINNVFCVYTEVMAQMVQLFLNKTTPPFQLLPISKVHQS